MTTALTICALAEFAAAQSSTRGAGPNQALLDGLTEKKREVVGLSLAATGEQVVELRIEGNRTIPTTQIVNQIQTRAGRPFDPRIVQRDVRKLSSLTWFVNVKPLYQKTAEGRVVIFRVTERPPIRYVEFLGNRRIKDKTLLKEVGLQAGTSLDPFVVQDGRRKILDLYKSNGFNGTQVTVLEGHKSTHQGVTYVINEGMSQRIWSVDFVGAKFVTPRRLKTRIESKRPTLLLFKGFVDEDQIEADKETLTNYYRAFGFYQARIGRKIEPIGRGNWVNLTFVIHEGPRYAVRNVNFIGNKLIAAGSLASGLKMPSGQPYERAKMNDDLRWLKEVYGSQGYIFADVRAEQVLLEEPGQLDLVYHVEEGKRWRIGRIFVNISGEHTHSRVQTALNRLSLQPGDVADIREIRASERRLVASGLFLSDPIQGVAPKITFRIPELESVEFSAARGNGNVRGQSPDAPRSHPGYGVAKTSKYYEVRRPPENDSQNAIESDAIDIHLDFGKFDEPEGEQSHAKESDELIVRAQSPAYSSADGQRTNYQQPRGNWQPVRRNTYTARPSQTQPAYSSYTVRTQSPYQAPSSQASQAFGGTIPGATGPQAAPIGYGTAGAAQTGPVQQAQFAQPLPPPGTPAPQQVFQGPPLTAPNAEVVPAPGITPIPGQPVLAPQAPFSNFNPYAEPAVDVYVDVAEAPTGRFQIGAGINSDAGVVGTISLDERNFDIMRPPTSWNDFVEGRAWRGAGQRFRLEAAPGTEVQRYLASFSEPYLFDLPISLGLSGSFFERRFRDWDEQRLGGRVSLGYQWVEHDLSATLGYRGEHVNINDVNALALAAAPGVPEYAAMNGDNFLHGFRIGLTNDTRDSAFFPTEGHLIDLSFEQVVGTFDYPRAILDIREYALIRERPDHSGRHVLSGSTRLGFTGKNTPLYEHFFAGGFSTLRGFDFRGASPVRILAPGLFSEFGGDFMWINSIEYLFPLTADDMIHGVVFCDFGTVEERVAFDPENFRVAPGVGLRLTIPAIGPAPIALDFAWGIERARTDDLQVFSFNVGFAR